MRKLYFFFLLLIITSCSTKNVLVDVSSDPNFNNENFNDVFIIVNIWGVSDEANYYKNLTNHLTAEFKKRGIDATAFIYNKNMVNGDEILRQKLSIFNPKYIMEFKSVNDIFIVIKEVESEDEIWKAFLRNPYVSSETYTQIIFSELQKHKIIKPQ
jgi:hypothetical protein